MPSLFDAWKPVAKPAAKPAESHWAVTGKTTAAVPFALSLQELQERNAAAKQEKAANQPGWVRPQAFDRKQKVKYTSSSSFSMHNKGRKMDVAYKALAPAAILLPVGSKPVRPALANVDANATLKREEKKKSPKMLALEQAKRELEERRRISLDPAKIVEETTKRMNRVVGTPKTFQAVTARKLAEREKERELEARRVKARKERDERELFFAGIRKSGANYRVFR